MAKSAREVGLEARVGALEQLVLGLLFQQRNELAMWNAQDAVVEMLGLEAAASGLSPSLRAELARCETVREQTLGIVQAAVDPDLVRQWREEDS